VSTAVDRARYDRRKRVVDVCIAALGLMVTAPLQVALALVVRSRLGRPAYFRQERPGLGGNAFTLVKFRTMLPVDAAGGLIDDADRLTPFGRWLRSTSLDELPTLWNVLRGDMSLVGPRPLLMTYVGRYTPKQARRHEVRPGITGLAQTAGRNALSWEKKFVLDVIYVDARCANLDARILARTIKTVATRKGITADGEATMPEFQPRPQLTSVGART
jgi:lipopolysaccharide/colanic/teichoic acid biosynthesis glycosyltransferase